MWEHWNGVDTDGVAHDSLNHYAKGAVAGFLHRYVAGLDLPDDPIADGPAYRLLRVRPRPGGGITWARASHESPYGRIDLCWSLANGRLELDLTVPPGTTAEVTWPDGGTRIVGPGVHEHLSGHRTAAVSRVPG
jgi:alpha-L-rhamnosidase